MYLSVNMISSCLYRWSNLAHACTCEWCDLCDSLSLASHLHLNLICGPIRLLTNRFNLHKSNSVCVELDMSTARRRRKSPRSLYGTSADPNMVTLVNIMVLNGWLASFSIHVNQPPHSWDKAISDSDLETPKVKVMGVVKGQGHA